MGKNTQKRKNGKVKDKTDSKATTSSVQSSNSPTSASSSSKSSHSKCNVSDSTCPISKGSKNEREHDHYPEWDPMKGVSSSMLNSATYSSSMINKLLTGVGDLKTENILCPFNNAKGGCYKKGSCRYKHVAYSAKILAELPKLASVSVSNLELTNNITSLPTQILPANDCITKAVIISAMDPGNFYIIPEHGWKCLCSNQSHENSVINGQPVNSYDTLEKLQSALQTHFKNSSSETKSHTEFLATEVVAVRLSATNGTNAWFRAKVLKDAVVCSNDEMDLFSKVEIELQLLDYGLKCIKSSNDVAPLPVQFCNISPMAFKCKLFGVSPILGTWGTTATKKFGELVLDRYVIVEVIRTSSHPWYSVEEESSITVNLFVKFQDGSYVNVAQELIHTGLGIEWNMYPKRPLLNEILAGHQHKFSLL